MPAVLRLPSVLTHEQAVACSVALRKAIALQATADGVTVDASALQRFDSSALAVLLDCRRTALSLDQVFRVSGLPSRLRRLADLYGVADLMPAAA